MSSDTALIRISYDQTLQERPLVLVVHPSAEVRGMLMIALDFDGFDVMTMADCDQPSIVLALTPPEVLVTDAHGAEARAELQRRARSQSPSVPVIAFDDTQRFSGFSRNVPDGVELVTREEGLGRLFDVLYQRITVGRARPGPVRNDVRMSV
ncbi:MAG: hypothetical protein JOZ75_14685 [Candidatus Dormibacteraeota bacterium]|nr:hypothetical protein [Candidatus Dormibacteraeota bacterium]